VPTKGDGSYNMKEAAKLGRTQGSHGCIRLSVPDSKWLMDNIPDGTKVVIKDH
jgi:lipoprotein-anchoring transpeptidase ErfK/SrfK